jgi:hypothetical protein
VQVFDMARHFQLCIGADPLKTRANLIRKVIIRSVKMSYNIMKDLRSLPSLEEVTIIPKMEYGIRTSADPEAAEKVSKDRFVNIDRRLSWFMDEKKHTNIKFFMVTAHNIQVSTRRSFLYSRAESLLTTMQEEKSSESSSVHFRWRISVKDSINRHTVWLIQATHVDFELVTRKTYPNADKHDANVRLSWYGYPCV